MNNNLQVAGAILTPIEATYCGGHYGTVLKTGYKYKFSLHRDIDKGYWIIEHTSEDNDDDFMGVFSCINAIYTMFKDIKMIKKDGSVIAF